MSLDNDSDAAPDCVDTDDDNDGVEDEADAFPLDPNEASDTDGDGTGNNTDTDDDGDGFTDEDEVARQIPWIQLSHRKTRMAME